MKYKYECDEPMPWGKYKGTRLDAVPASYMRWCLDNLDFQGHLREAIQALLDGRPVPEDDVDGEARLDEIVKPWEI